MADVISADAVAELEADPDRRTAADRMADTPTDTDALPAIAEFDCIAAVAVAAADMLVARRT